MTAWAGTAQAYRHSFARACAGGVEPLLAATRVVAASSVGEELRHLDVGCGDGRLAAAAAAAGRVVVACDADAAMCDLARAQSPHVPVVQAAVPALPWRCGSFDVVTANFVVNHVDDPRASVREMVRVCRPGGVVTATIWPAGGAGFGELLRPIFAMPGVLPPADTPLPAAVDFERSPRGLGDLFCAAGMDDVIAVETAWTWNVTPEDLWAGITAGVATPGATFLAQPAETRSRMQAAFFDAARAASVDGVLSFGARAVLASGRPG